MKTIIQALIAAAALAVSPSVFAFGHGGGGGHFGGGHFGHFGHGRGFGHRFFFDAGIGGFPLYYGYFWPGYYGYPAGYGYPSPQMPMEAAVQSALAQKGFYKGPIDGDIGPASKGAILHYQASRGLAQTGVIDGVLLKSLGMMK